LLIDRHRGVSAISMLRPQGASSSRDDVAGEMAPVAIGGDVKFHELLTEGEAEQPLTDAANTSKLLVFGCRIPQELCELAVEIAKLDRGTRRIKHMPRNRVGASEKACEFALESVVRVIWELRFSHRYLHRALSGARDT
jgi:hypothetical protein